MTGESGSPLIAMACADLPSRRSPTSRTAQAWPLQHDIPASALARSVARLPTEPLAPPYLDQPGDSRGKRPGSVIGAALDLVCSFENGATE